MAILLTSVTAGAATALPAALECEWTGGKSCHATGNCEDSISAASIKSYLIIVLADNTYRNEMRFADGEVAIVPSSGKVRFLNNFKDVDNPAGFRLLLGTRAILTIFRSRDNADRFQAVSQHAVDGSARMYWYACSSNAAA